MAAAAGVPVARKAKCHANLMVIMAEDGSALTRQDMEVSFVIIDKAPSVGMTLRQIADYAAMRGLVRTKPPAPGGSIDTILSAFDSTAAPVRELTATDAAYLRALYSSKGMTDSVTERNAITRRIAKGK